MEVWAITASAGDAEVADRDRIGQAMAAWLAEGNQGVLLATCHRVELYGLGLTPGLDSPHVHTGRTAIAHLLRVAAGLESAIVGEDEVLHQVRDALRVAQLRGQPDFRLRRLFETAIAVGRRARSGRTASSGSLAQITATWLNSRSGVSDRAVLVAGAGRMGAALAHSLADAGAVITIASRDERRAKRLARVYSGNGVTLSEGARLAGQSAAVAVALGGPWTDLASIESSHLPPIADISAPQAVPDSVRDRLNGSFLGIDDLYRRSDPVPGAYIKDAEALVDRHTGEYAAWLEGRR